MYGCHISVKSIMQMKLKSNGEKKIKMSYIFLIGAIILELIATSLLKYTEGFTKLYPTLGCIVLYIICFACLAKAILKLNLGIAYATWCGVGIVVTTCISVFILKEHISPVGVLGIVMIVIGSVILNLFGNVH